MIPPIGAINSSVRRIAKNEHLSILEAILPVVGTGQNDIPTEAESAFGDQLMMYILF